MQKTCLLVLSNGSVFLSFKDSHGRVPTWDVSQMVYFATAVAGLLEMDFKGITHQLLVQDIWNPCQQDGPSTD